MSEAHRRVRVVSRAALVLALASVGVLGERDRTPVEQVAGPLNVFLLSDHVTDRVLIEVDWVEGLTPNRRALDSMVDALRRVTPAGKTIELRIDDEIPRATWDAAPGRAFEKLALFAETLDADPSAWRDREVLYVVYVPDEADVHGWQLPLPIERDGKRGVVPGIVIYQSELESEAALWIGPRKIERAILVHELGHALGLVANPEHQTEGDLRHCTRAGCVLASRTPRARTHGAFAAVFAGKVPYRFCKLCRADLRRAAAYWKQRSAADDDFRRDAILRRAAWEAAVFAARKRASKPAGDPSSSADAPDAPDAR